MERQRGREDDHRQRAPGHHVGDEARLVGRAAESLAGVCAAWVVILFNVLSHRVYTSHDTISNYVHVWYIADRLRHGHGIPFHMPVLGHGQAFAFPYAFIPWTTAAVAWLLVGEWAVTLWLVLGFLAAVAATFYAFPELRRGWWPATVLANPVLVVSPLIGQLPFLWAIAMLLAGVGCWRRGHRWPAALLVGLGQAGHPAVVLPIGMALVIGRLRREPDRRALIGWYAISLAIAAPAVWIVLRSPVFVESSTWTIVSNFFGTVIARSFVVTAPLVLVLVDRRRRRWAPVLFGAAIVLNGLLVAPLNSRYAWTALIRQPSTTLLGFIRSPEFTPGATYRILRAGDGKVGMYQLLRGGARLDSELFPESIDRRSWGDAGTYSRFLRSRDVDAVIVFATYDRKFHTDEHRLLDALSAPRPCDGAVRTVHVVQSPPMDVYRVLRSCP